MSLTTNTTIGQHSIQPDDSSNNLTIIFGIFATVLTLAGVMVAIVQVFHRPRLSSSTFDRSPTIELRRYPAPTLPHQPLQHNSPPMVGNLTIAPSSIASTTTSHHMVRQPDSTIGTHRHLDVGGRSNNNSTAGGEDGGDGKSSPNLNLPTPPQQSTDIICKCCSIFSDEPYAFRPYTARLKVTWSAVETVSSNDPEAGICGVPLFELSQRINETMFDDQICVHPHTCAGAAISHWNRAYCAATD